MLPFGLTADGFLVTLVAAMAFLSVWAVWYALLEKHPMERRARMLAARRNELRGQMLKDKGAALAPEGRPEPDAPGRGGAQADAVPADRPSCTITWPRPGCAPATR